MSSVDTRPVPTNLLRWPRTRDLITQYKGILMYLWAHPQQTACGCYLLPLDATAADLSMSSSSLADALAEFMRRGLVDLDHATGEILLPDWFRFYTPRTAAARGAVESAIRKILSTELSRKAEKAYKSTTLGWKGKEKEKGKGKASSEEEELSGAKAGPSLPAAIKAGENRPNLPQRSHAGIRCWTSEDMIEARAIEGKYGLERVSLIVKEFESKRVEPLPSRVSRTFQEQTARPAGKWWASDESTIATASQLDLHPHPGESMEAFRQRIYLRLAQLDVDSVKQDVRFTDKHLGRSAEVIVAGQVVMVVAPSRLSVGN